MNIAEALEKIAEEYHGKVVNPDGSIGHRRKYSGEPYTVHTKEVRDIYASVAPDDILGHAIAHGHDLFEDTVLTPVELTRILLDMGFPAADVDIVVAGIAHLSDIYTAAAYPGMNRKGRKRKERERLGTIPDREKGIKLADLISNTRDIVKNDPDFARVYLDEKEAALPYLIGGHSDLLNRATHQLLDSKRALGLTIHVVSSGS